MTNLKFVDFSGLPKLRLIGEEAFSGCSNFEGFTFYNPLRVIDVKAFASAGQKDKHTVTIYLNSELEEIVSKSVENAKLIGEKVLDDANKTALTIKENTNKALENSKTILKNELLRRASLASVEVARHHIINELSWNQGLHDKLIDESLDTIGGLEL